MRVTVLGCGWSSGVPIVGCTCAICRSDNPRNRRRRVSILVEEGATRLLVDSSPDLRAQLLDAGVSRLDAVLYTHLHADHVHGIDDLRAINFHIKGPLPAYGSGPTMKAIEARFPYAFGARKPQAPWFAPSLLAREIDGRFAIGEVEIDVFDQLHGPEVTTGYRFGSVAYSTDVKELPDNAFEKLENLKLWIVDCAGEKPHPTHSHLEQTLAWIERVKPKLAVLTHMSHNLDYDHLRAILPAGVLPAHDGMVIEVDEIGDKA
jgi:phosphoribosyl 1,2-cyclic phosphate phosphodiesterase